MDFSKDPIYASMPKELREAVDDAAAIQAVNVNTTQKALGFIDNTSLNGNETPGDIIALCDGAKEYSETAAICIYGERVRPGLIEVGLRELSGTGIKLAVVNAFPYPYDFSPEEIKAETLADLEAGAQEFDTVLDVQAFKSGNLYLAGEKLRAVRQTIDEFNKNSNKPPVILKTILNSAAFDNAIDLYDAAVFALSEGADFVKTSTGKDIKAFNIEKDSATLPISCVLMQAAKNYKMANNGIVPGMKVAGGLKSPVDVARYFSLATDIMGAENVTPDKLRFGASASFKQTLLGYIKDPENFNAGQPNPGAY